jgi:hypothetical protein
MGAYASRADRAGRGRPATSGRRRQRTDCSGRAHEHPASLLRAARHRGRPTTAPGAGAARAPARRPVRRRAARARRQLPRRRAAPGPARAHLPSLGRDRSPAGAASWPTPPAAPSLPTAHARCLARPARARRRHADAARPIRHAATRRPRPVAQGPSRRLARCPSPSAAGAPLAAPWHRLGYGLRRGAVPNRRPLSVPAGGA